MKKIYQAPCAILLGVEHEDVLTASVQYQVSGWGNTLNVSDFEDDPIQ